MAIFRSVLERVLQGLALILGWGFLCGIDRGGSNPNFGLSDLESKNMFQSMPPPSAWPLSFWITLFILIVGPVATIYGLRYLKEKQEKAQMEKIADEQAQLGVDTELEDKKVEDTMRKFIAEVVGTDDPIEVLPVVKDPVLFEEKIEAYKATPRCSADKLAKIYALRKSMQFTINYPEIPFIKTQMLIPNIRLECQLEHKNKMVNFMSSVLEVHEDRFLIKPPMVKKRPANLKQFPTVTCKLTREGDADYEFKAPVIDQLLEGSNGVILGHTPEIRKMVIRESERVPMEMTMDFNFIQQAAFEAEQVGGAAGPRVALSGKVEDMSAGGMMIQIGSMPSPEISTDDVMEFHLARANLRGMMLANVVRVVDKGGLFNLHLRFRNVDQLMRIKLNQYLHRAKKSKQAA
jgi:c-di-GMP-binding flagellar brake protein YcgR